ncbi:MAG: hypothetical protein WDN30_07705 [Pararobbsia sp.]
MKAIELAGTQAALAKVLQRVAPKVKQQHISYWLCHGVPIRRARQIVDVLPESGPLSDFFAEAGERCGSTGAISAPEANAERS